MAPLADVGLLAPVVRIGAAVVRLGALLALIVGGIANAAAFTQPADQRRWSAYS